MTMFRTCSNYIKHLITGRCTDMAHTESLFIITVLLWVQRYPQYAENVLWATSLLLLINTALDLYRAYLEMRLRKLKKDKP